MEAQIPELKVYEDKITTYKSGFRSTTKSLEGRMPSSDGSSFKRIKYCKIRHKQDKSAKSHAFITVQQIQL